MSVSVRRLAESFVGEVSEVDLTRLDAAATRSMRRVGVNFPADLRVPF